MKPYVLNKKITIRRKVTGRIYLPQTPHKFCMKYVQKHVRDTNSILPLNQHFFEHVNIQERNGMLKVSHITILLHDEQVIMMTTVPSLSPSYGNTTNTNHNATAGSENPTKSSSIVKL